MIYLEAITNAEDLISQYANKLAIDKILQHCVISSRWCGKLPALSQPYLRCSFLSFCRLLHKPPNAWLCYGTHALHKRKRSLNGRCREGALPSVAMCVSVTHMRYKLRGMAGSTPISSLLAGVLYKLYITRISN